MFDSELEGLYERTAEISDYLGSRFTMEWPGEASEPNGQFRPMLNRSRPEDLRIVGEQLDILLALPDEDSNQYVVTELQLDVDEQLHLGKSYREWFVDLRHAVSDRLRGGDGAMPPLQPARNARPASVEERPPGADDGLR